MAGGMAEFLIITGLSGAGRSQAAATFEDLGWFVIDNMPTALITRVAELVMAPGQATSQTERVVLVVGRAGGQLDELTEAIAQLRATNARVRVLFLDASDDVLVRRFEGTRRRHPMPGEGVVESIALERALLDPIQAAADVVLDTSDLNVHQLRDRLVEMFASEDAVEAMQISVVSFGYKHGIPRDVDMVFDCRFLPNPHWVEELRPLSGQDQPVRDYVMAQPETKEFLIKLDDMLGLLVPAFVKEGKAYLTVAVGCTGGRHRSVVLAEEISRLIGEQGYHPTVNHRDINR
jgi:RNase adapter protein RapZ